MTTYRHGENTLLPVSEVPKGGKMGNADLAQAVALGLTLEQYQGLKVVNEA